MKTKKDPFKKKKGDVIEKNDVEETKEGFRPNSKPEDKKEEKK